MKFLFVALLYFSCGFLFANLSTLASLVLGALMVIVTFILVLNLFDDRFEGAYLQD